MRYALHDICMLYIPTMKPIYPSSSSSSSSSTSMKIKRLIHTLVLSHVCRVARGLSRAKTILVEVFKEHQQITRYNKYKKKYCKDYYKKNFFGSFRMHYNWCSSHSLPVPAPVLGAASRHFYYDSTWGSLLSMDNKRGGGQVMMNVEEEPIRQLSGYLQWLEEKVDGEDGHDDDNYYTATTTDDDHGNNKSSRQVHDRDRDRGHHQHHRSADHHIHEIDQLADAFIAGFHEKFLLEKQESYRRFQEMLDRSM